MHSNADPNITFQADQTHAILTWGDGTSLTIPYDSQTHLPIVTAFQNALMTANALALKGCITKEINQNLTCSQKLLLQFHYHFGHPGFSLVQYLGHQGWLGCLGEKMGHTQLQAPSVQPVSLVNKAIFPPLANITPRILLEP